MTRHRNRLRLRPASSVVVPAAVVAVVVALAAAGCPGRQGRGVRPDGAGGPDEREPGVLVEDTEVSVPLDGGKEARLGALLLRPEGASGPLPAVLVVPGGGNVSRKNTRASDGVAAYPAPVDVGLRWGEALAKEGLLVLLWDKRTCRPTDAPECAANPTGDVDEKGPLALARDVDAACAAIKAAPGFDGRIVLWAHGQGAQVALSSSCAAEAHAFVLAAPPPRAIDQVLVAALDERAKELAAKAKAEKDPAAKTKLSDEAHKAKEAAATRSATFASMKGGQFAKDATVLGATVGFWRGWMELTGKTSDLMGKAPGRKLVVLGETDRQYAEVDRKAIRALAEKQGAAFLELPGCDHHLLEEGKVGAGPAAAVADKLRQMLEGPPPS